MQAFLFPSRWHWAHWMSFCFAVHCRSMGFNPRTTFSKCKSHHPLIKLTFSFLGLAIAIKAFVGPIIGMLVVLFSRAHAKSSPLSINSAINFIVKRYKNVFMPYLLAMLSIQVGMLIVIPGIMFMMQYAFVDSVATLEKEKHVLTRSKRLTKSRRKSLVMLIFTLLYCLGRMQFVDFIYSSNLPALIGFHSLYEGFFLNHWRHLLHALPRTCSTH